MLLRNIGRDGGWTSCNTRRIACVAHARFKFPIKVQPARAVNYLTVFRRMHKSSVYKVIYLTSWSHGLGKTLDELRAPCALATRNGSPCMPSMIESLVDGLGFARSRVELLVPLTISLLRVGPIVYCVCATLFIAQLYGHALGIVELATVPLAWVLAGFASAGMTGLVMVSLICARPLKI